MSHVTRTGWRRCIGCLKLQVIFRKRATNYRALFRKMIYEDKASYDSTPPCMNETKTFTCTDKNMSHVTHMSETCCTHEWVMSHM